MRSLLLAIVGLALAGCTGAPSTPDLAPPDVAFFARLSAEGELPSWYVLQVREHEEDRPLNDQDGPVLWQAEGEVRPGTNETEAHALDGDREYWVEGRFERTPDLARTASTGFEFHLDPKACADIVALVAMGRSSLTAWGTSGDVIGCPG